VTDEEQQLAAREAVDCRRCHQAAGQPCTTSDGQAMPTEEGGLIVHPARLHDWQALQAG